MNYNIIIPNHPFFNKKYIVINPNIKPSDKIVKAGVFFKFKDLKLKKFDQQSVDFQKLLYHLRSIFNYSRLKETPDLDENTVVIHIRSGDIFKNCIHPAYISPPFSYYENILDNNSFSKIILISENTANPCVNLLLEKYKNKISYKKNPLTVDISILLKAKMLIESFGSFSNNLILFSENLKKLYKPSYQGKNLFEIYDKERLEVHRIDLKAYHKKMKPWKANSAQINLIKNYRRIV
tara:strand:- start:42 stop:752 length:711 start_codon:yes stop_codon:yes gene_type:complete